MMPFLSALQIIQLILVLVLRCDSGHRVRECDREHAVINSVITIFFAGAAIVFGFFVRKYFSYKETDMKGVSKEDPVVNAADPKHPTQDIQS